MARAQLPSSTAGRIALVAAFVALLLCVLAQFVLPGLGAGKVEDRLTANGGEADVTLTALPAVRLLWGDGDRLAVAASGLDLELAREGEGFSRVDPFADVDIRISGSRAGPIEIEELVLIRSGDDPYALTMRGTSSAAELAGASGVPGSGIMGSLLGTTELGDRPLAIDFDMKVASDEGGVSIVSGGGEIGGIPTGPLAEVVVTAIAAQL